MLRPLARHKDKTQVQGAERASGQELQDISGKAANGRLLDAKRLWWPLFVTFGAFPLPPVSHTTLLISLSTLPFPPHPSSGII